MKKSTLVIVGIMLFSVIASIVEAGLIMLLWNYLVVNLFAIPKISFWVVFVALRLLSLIGSWFSKG